MNLKATLTENQILVVFLGLLAGLFFPEIFQPLHPWNSLMLQIVFFFSALRINFRDVVNYLHDWKMVLAANAFMLVVLPVVAYFPLSYFLPDWALPFLICLAGPTGMTIALIADFFGGKASLALVIAITTSILAPFTMPILFKALVGTAVPFDALAMLVSLMKVIFIPFLLAGILQRFAPKLIERGNGAWRTLSVIVFGVLIASIVGATAQEAASSLTLSLHLKTIVFLMGAFAFLALLIWGSYRMVYWRKASERITIALCMVYMNFTLALWVGDTFFAEQLVVPKMVVILLVLDAMLPFIKVFAGKVIEDQALPGRLAHRKPIPGLKAGASGWVCNPRNRLRR